MDPLLLARAQFAANMSFHILFPTITIALGWILLFIRLRWLKTGDDAWRALALRALRSFVGEYRAWGQFAASYANAVARALREPVSVVVVGRMGDATAEALWRASRASGDPDVVALHLDPGVSPDAIAERGFPLERTAAYVCVGTACSAPLADEGSLRRELESARDRVASVP